MKLRTAGWALWASLLVGTPALLAEEPPPAPDNTEKNQEPGMTADDQGMSAADTQMTGKIRASIMKIDNLSAYAKNVKIITKNGKVTLRGPVRDASEKAAIEKATQDVAGAPNVTSELTIAPPKK